jgi:hypothetical protein
MKNETMDQRVPSQRNRSILSHNRSATANEPTVNYAHERASFALQFFPGSGIDTYGV